MRSPLPLLTLGLAAVGALFHAHAATGTQDAPTLEFGRPEPVVLSPLEEEFPVLRLEVPRGATAVRITTLGADDDVLLLVGEGYEPDVGWFDASGPGVWIDEELLLVTEGTVPLAPGEWFVRVVPGDYSLFPDQLRPVRCEVLAELVEPTTATLRLGEVQELELDLATGMRCVLTLAEGVEVERRGEYLVEVWSPDGDVDLLAGAGAPGMEHDFPYARATRDLNYEHLRLDGRQLERARIHAFALPELSVHDRLRAYVRVVVAEDWEAAAPLVPAVVPPSVAPDASAMERALASTVAVFGPLGGGSGVLVSPAGLVLTNAHVVLGADLPAGDSPSLHMGPTVDPREAAMPLCGMELVAYDEDLDLALCRITTALDGRPLPAGLTWPTPVLGDPATVALGDPLQTLGFPMTGGGASHVSVTLTHGICAGFSMEEAGLMIKTDAGTHSGLSGGALLDAEGRFLGVPSSSIGDANQAGGLGFALPLTAVPEGWLP